MYISVLQTTYHPKHKRPVYICSPDHMWSGEQIYTCRSCLGWYVIWRTDIYMSFMVRMVCGLENRYIQVVYVSDGMWSGEQIYTCRSSHTILNMNDMCIFVLQTTYHPKHERPVYICSPDHIPS
jgi:hypothetical protein